MQRKAVTKKKTKTRIIPKTNVLSHFMRNQNLFVGQYIKNTVGLGNFVSKNIMNWRNFGKYVTSTIF